MILEYEMIHGCPAPAVAARSRRQPRQRGGDEGGERQPSGACEGRPCGPNRQKSGALQDLVGKPPMAGVWDASTRFYREMQKSEETGSARSRLHARIEEETPISPRALAESVCEETSLWLDEDLPHEWVAELVERANVVYQHNPRFRGRLRVGGNAGRDRLMAFMRHWLCAMLFSRRPDLAARLPSSYAIGHDLPPGDEESRREVGLQKADGRRRRGVGAGWPQIGKDEK